MERALLVRETEGEFTGRYTVVTAIRVRYGSLLCALNWAIPYVLFYAVLLFIRAMYAPRCVILERTGGLPRSKTQSSPPQSNVAA